MVSPRKIRMGLALAGFAALAVVYSACATGGGGGGNEPITVQVDNQTNLVVTVERVVAAGAGQPVTVRVAQVRGESQDTLTIPWHPSRLAHQLLWFDGLNSSTYRVEECASEGACAETTALHLPPGAEVSLLIDTRLEVTMYYRAPSG